MSPPQVCRRDWSLLFFYSWAKLCLKQGETIAQGQIYESKVGVQNRAKRACFMVVCTCMNVRMNLWVSAGFQCPLVGFGPGFNRKGTKIRCSKREKSGEREEKRKEKKKRRRRRIIIIYTLNYTRFLDLTPRDRWNHTQLQMGELGYLLSFIHHKKCVSTRLFIKKILLEPYTCVT